MFKKVEKIGPLMAEISIKKNLIKIQWELYMLRMD